ncbi:flagellar basal body-associated FliL family protein [Magnetovibrio sp. PR-2]|uniref:flagellar basal body-associated FliL family protein n=1 Tax=Magnetovibrio sp. PR-2 TaxID=3120356 RepID=UPI002FCE2380
MSDDAKAPEDQNEDPKDAEKADEAETKAEDASEDGSDEAEGEAPKKSKLKFIIIGVVAVLLIGGGAGAYFMGLFSSEKPHEATLMMPGPPTYHELGTVTVDLKPEQGRPRPFIRVTFTAELQGEAGKTAAAEHEVKINDAIRSHLRTVSPSDLSGEEGTERLRTDLTIIINRVIAPQHCITVLYQDLMIR